MLFQRPRITISALKGGSGKTLLSLGLSHAWRGMGHKVAVFKKGPDFIDSGWLAFAARRPCYNLDPFLMTPGQILDSFTLRSSGMDISVIEGNRGLFDGMDLEGCSSTAELGRILQSPVVIIADVTMATRTVAALILGCQRFDPELNLAGVVLNRVAGSRQESVVRQAIEHYCGLPVVGSMPKLKGNIFPERHMGLVPHLESAYAEKAVNCAKEAVEKNLDLQTLWKVAHDATPLEQGLAPAGQGIPLNPERKSPRIGVIRDRAFWFYYPENLEQLEKLGAAVVEINAMEERALPDLDALYIGGGFPETQAEALTENGGFMASLREEIERGLPVYAECGGLMYLGERLQLRDRAYPMVGALPLTFLLEEKPQGHGYTILEVTDKNPYYPVGEVLKGHEFHYSRALLRDSRELHTAFKVLRGRGLDGQRDGVWKKNLLATYTHLHAAGSPLWGEALVRAALRSPDPGVRDFSKSSEKRD